MSENESITPAGTNVYAALGTPDADGMLVRAQLATRIAHIIKQKAFTQAKAATVIEMTEAELSAMLRGQFRGISERKMMACLIALGENVAIDIKPAPSGEAARLSVRTTDSGPVRRPRTTKPSAVTKTTVRELA